MQNPYEQYNGFNYPPKQPLLGDKGSNKRKVITGAGILTVFTAIIVPIVVALINAHILFAPPVPPTQVPTTAPTQPVPTSPPNTPLPAFPPLVSFYQGTMNRVFDGAVLHFNLQQVSEDSQIGKFTASSVINGCPANVVGQVNNDDTITFEAQESPNCQNGSIIDAFSGIVNSNGSMGGQWSIPNTQVGGSWSATPA